jgi:hypothetical protein
MAETVRKELRASCDMLAELQVSFQAVVRLFASVSTALFRALSSVFRALRSIFRALRSLVSRFRR